MGNNPPFFFENFCFALRSATIVLTNPAVGANNPVAWDRRIEILSQNTAHRPAGARRTSSTSYFPIGQHMATGNIFSNTKN